MMIIKDLGVITIKEGSRKRRAFIHECVECKQHFRVVSDYNKNKELCSSCCRSKSKTTHGGSTHRLYLTWLGMIGRCTKANNPGYRNYGGRGIGVSDEFTDFNIWLKYVEGLEFYKKAGYTIDRIDNDGNYEKGNIRWASRMVQGSNTRRLKDSNTSGYRGVGWHKKAKKWYSGIKINYKQKHLGLFDNAIDAAKAYDKYVLDNNLEHTINGV